MNARTLDAKDLRCPLPVLRARKILRQMAAGEILEVEATDPGAVRDFPAFCETTGHLLLWAGEVEGVFRFRIEKVG